MKDNKVPIYGILAITLEPDHQNSWFLYWGDSFMVLYPSPLNFGIYFGAQVEGFAQLGYYE